VRASTHQTSVETIGIMLALSSIALTAWSAQPRLFVPSSAAAPAHGFVATAHSSSRREALSFFSAGAAAATFALPLPVLAAKDPKVLQENLVLILRVKEATSQETRLIKSGKYKELQRLNIKRAIGFMLENYDLRDRFVTASVYASQADQGSAQSFAGTAVESLIQIIEYFPRDLVANDLSPEQRTFVLRALESTSSSIDNFLSLMPEEAVTKANAQVAEENELNEKEYQDEDGKGILNSNIKKA